MKAERRHELQTNSLALWLRWRAPQLWQQYGSQMLLGLVVVMALVVFIQWRINAPKAAATEAEKVLANGRTLLQGLEYRSVTPGDAAQILEFSKTALAGTDNRDIQAKAHLLMGDYYWALANYPPMPKDIASTRPFLAPDLPADQLLSKARDAYALAAKDQPEQGVLQAAAHLGLAAVAETQAGDADRKSGGKADPAKNPDWATATQEYQAVINLALAPQVLKDEAKFHLAQIPSLQQPVWIVAATQPASTQPGSLAPAGPVEIPGPTTAPAAAATPKVVTAPKMATIRPASTQPAK